MDGRKTPRERASERAVDSSAVSTQAGRYVVMIPAWLYGYMVHGFMDVEPKPKPKLESKYDAMLS